MRENIFISYTRADLDVVRPIYLFLQAMRFKPWMDVYDLPPGSVFTQEIEKQIRESDYFIACLSTHSVDKRGFVQKELKIALDVFDEFPEGQIFLVPARLDECEVPYSFKHLNWIDMFLPGAKLKLLQAFTRSKNIDSSQVHKAMRRAELFSPKHHEGRIAYRNNNYAEAERLAREAYDDIPNPHSKLNEQVAAFAQGKITNLELDEWVYRLELQNGSHGRSVLAKGY